MPKSDDNPQAGKLQDAAQMPAPVADPPPEEKPTPVADALDKTGGENYLVDQMYDVLERARIEAQGRTHDLSIRFGAEQAEVAGEEGEHDVWANRFFVQRDGAETLHGLTVDEAKAALDAISA